VIDNRLLSACALAVALIWSVPSFAQVVPQCGSLQNAYGPFDYRDPANQKQLALVEQFHFSNDVETLRSHNAISDLDYTLRAFPNHSRALNSLSRYALRGGRKWPNPSVRSADCYFKRALAFRADDVPARMIYANHLARTGKVPEAEREYEQALALDPDGAEVNYNAGLFYLKIDRLEEAKKRAAVAYENGYPLPGLRNKIAEAEKKKNVP
jgi:tetratricopeptide (TPR) repeat protein